MRTPCRAASGVLLSLTLAMGIVASLTAQKNDKDKDSKNRAAADRPKLALRAQPSVAIAPARVVLTAELSGGADDYQEFYCPTIRWEWGDLSSSEAASDCAPYEPGKTEIKRRFTVEHKFEHAGSYKVYFRMRHGSKEIAATSTVVKVQPGAYDGVQ